MKVWLVGKLLCNNMEDNTRLADGFASGSVVVYFPITVQLVMFYFLHNAYRI